MFRRWLSNRLRGGTHWTILGWVDLRWLPVLAAVALCVMVASDRNHTAERWRWVFTGVITDRYRSSNHGAYSVRVDGVPYEFVAESFWQEVKVGDHVAKDGCSPEGRVNGHAILVVNP